MKIFFKHQAAWLVGCVALITGAIFMWQVLPATAAVCGNNQVESGEVCDGANLNGQTCQTQGLNDGNLKCHSNCLAFDNSSCSSGTSCMDTDDNETSTRGIVLGVDNGRSWLIYDECNSSGTQVKEWACDSQGAKGTWVNCPNGCVDGICRELSAVCGNGQIDVGEVCDGNDLGGLTCLNRGYAGGTMSCAADCKSLVTSSCVLKPLFICSDSDGDNPNLKGQVAVENTVLDDLCVNDDTQVQEWVCDQNNYAVFKKHGCPNGCANGACISGASGNRLTPAKMIRGILKLNRLISVLEQRVIDLETRLTTAINRILTNRLRGYLIIQPEANGEVWYTSPDTGERFYVADGQAAYGILSGMGKGITGQNLKKVPTGYDPNLYGGLLDTDGDGLPDVLEEAIGTNPGDDDTDDDTFDDLTEVMGGYNPNGGGKIAIDKIFAKKLKGIYLDVDNRGAAWYINPKDFKRYYVSPETAYNVMKYLSLGVANKDLRQIPVGEVSE